MVKYKEQIMKVVFFIAALVSIAAVALICIFLFANGVPAMTKIGIFNFIGGSTWAPSNEPAEYGIFPMILGSIYVTAGALVVGVPIGLLTAVYLAKFCPNHNLSFFFIIINLYIKYQSQQLSFLQVFHQLFMVSLAWSFLYRLFVIILVVMEQVVYLPLLFFLE